MCDDVDLIFMCTICLGERARGHREEICKDGPHPSSERRKLREFFRSGTHLACEERLRQEREKK
jgi:hypothetical protein